MLPGQPEFKYDLKKKQKNMQLYLLPSDAVCVKRESKNTHV